MSAAKPNNGAGPSRAARWVSLRSTPTYEHLSFLRPLRILGVLCVRLFLVFTLNAQRRTLNLFLAPNAQPLRLAIDTGAPAGTGAAFHAAPTSLGPWLRLTATMK